MDMEFTIKFAEEKDTAIILNFIADHKEVFFEKHGVTKIGLFGSYARNDATKNSDINIAVEQVDQRKSLHGFFSLKHELKEAFHMKVDLGIEGTLKPLAKKYIMQDIIYA